MRSSLAALVLFMFANLSAHSADTNAARLVVLSYNIHHGAGLDGRLDLARIASVITSAAPDIVALQEVDAKTARSKGVHQAVELGRLTGMSAVFGSSMKYGGGDYGNAVLTRLPVLRHTVVSLPGEPRSALIVDIQIGAGRAVTQTISFISTHLDTREEPRKASLPLLENVVPVNPTVLAGDFNAPPESSELSTLLKTWGNATTGPGLPTFPASKPETQIDYILIRPASRWRIIESTVINEPVASDHRPIRAVFELRPE